MSERTLYQVKNWDQNFEGAKSKTYNNKTSCTMPTKHGLGYKRLVKRKDGGAIFGAWCALIQVLSRHPKQREGYCTDTGRIDGVPYDPSDLECLTDIQAKHFKSMYDVCSSQAVGWLALIKTQTPQGYCEDTNYPLNLDLDSNLNSDLDSDSDSCGKPISFGEFKNVRLTKNEHDKLIEIHGAKLVEFGIDELGSWLKRTGKTRKDHYACMNRSSFVWEKATKAMSASGITESEPIDLDAPL